MSRPGAMDQRITLRKKVLTDDGYGGQTESWSDIATVWASVRPASGSEQERFERLDALATYIFTIRNRSDLGIVAANQIQWDGRPYNIRFPAHPGDRAMYLEITAERGVAQ